MDMSRAPEITSEKLDDPQATMLEYKKTGDVTLRNQLVMHYLQYVSVAIYSMRFVLLSNIPFDDFFNQGTIALIECIDRYDPMRGEASFDTYSYTAIRGSILKYLRKQNWLPNRLWEARKKIIQTQTKLEQELMREPSYAEIASDMELTEEKLSHLMCEISVVDTVSLEELLTESFEKSLVSSREDSPDKNILMEEMRKALVKAIDALPIKQKQIISLFYYENLNLREIGEVVDLSPQRVSQLRKKALDFLKERMQDFT